MRGSGNKIDEGQIKKQGVKEFFIEQYNDTKARLPTLSKVRCYIVCNLLFVFVVASFFFYVFYFYFKNESPHQSSPNSWFLVFWVLRTYQYILNININK